MNYCLISRALDAHRFDLMQKCCAFGSNYFASLESIICRTLPGRIHRPGSVGLRHLGEMRKFGPSPGDGGKKRWTYVERPPKYGQKRQASHSRVLTFHFFP